MFRGEAKSDAKDARIIAETARMRADLTMINATGDLMAELTRLTGHREDLMADWVRGVNRLRDLLTSIFPALERSFDYSARSPLILLTGFQAPDSIRCAGEAGLIAYLHEHGAWAKGIPAMAAAALEAAKSQTVRLPGEAATALLIARLATQLLELDRQIKDTGKLIARRFRAHPQAEIIESLPGFGPVLGAEFIVATGGNLAAFTTPGRLASYAAWFRSRKIPAASPATCAVPDATADDSGACSTWPRCPASGPAAPPGPSTTANAANGSSTPRPCSPWPGAWSTCSGPSCATAGSSHQPRRSRPPPRLDTIIQIPSASRLSCGSSSGHVTYTAGRTRPENARNKLPSATSKGTGTRPS